MRKNTECIKVIRSSWKKMYKKWKKGKKFSNKNLRLFLQLLWSILFSGETLQQLNILWKMLKRQRIILHWMNAMNNAITVPALPEHLSILCSLVQCCRLPWTALQHHFFYLRQRFRDTYQYKRLDIKLCIDQSIALYIYRQL